MKKKVWYVLGAVLLIALGVWGIGALLPHQADILSLRLSSGW